MALRYYSALFAFELGWGHFPNINEESKAFLSREFSMEEILAALMSTSPLKAPGPGAINLFFISALGT